MSGTERGEVREQCGFCDGGLVVVGDGDYEGAGCHEEPCPYCDGIGRQEPPMTDHPSPEDWIIEEGVRCVVAPCCAFTFDAGHTDIPGGGYSCPACAEIRLLAEAAALRTEREEAVRLLRELRPFIDQRACAPQVDAFLACTDTGGQE